MEQTDVIRFFDRCAAGWDADMVRNEDVIRLILDNAGVTAGIDVLDVACGTGVLFPDYLGRGVKTVTGIDISPEMARIAQEKFPGIRVICGDAECYPFEQRFDVVMVYNAFPHFPDSARAICRFAKNVKPGGRLSIAHGMSREKLLLHHAGSARRVSIELPEADELAGMLLPWLRVDTVVSDERMYQVVGTRI